jgi:hypothetical protein
MKRFLAAALILGLMSSVGLVGCGEESKTEIKQSGPGGTTVQESKVKQSGDAPPAPIGEPGPKTP